MSYAMAGMGSYYYPGRAAMSGFGSYYYPSAVSGYGAFGGVAIDVSALWSDQMRGSAGDNAAGKRWAQTIQAALNELGYGGQNGIAVDGIWGPGTQAAWNAFADDQQPRLPHGWPTKQSLSVLKAALDVGGTPGGGASIQVPPGTEVPTKGGSGGAANKAGMSTATMAALGIGALVVLGGLAYVASQKKKGGSHASSDYASST